MTGLAQLDLFTFGELPATEAAPVVAVVTDDELVVAAEVEAVIEADAVELIADARTAAKCQCIPAPAPVVCWRCGRSADGRTAFGIATLIVDSEAGKRRQERGTA